MFQFADHALETLFLAERIRLIAVFDVLDTLMENLPHQPAEPVGGCQDGFVMSQAHDQTAVEFLEKAAFRAYCGVGGLA